MTEGSQLYSDYIVYVDESGDHGLGSIDPNYPVFVLVLCIFEKKQYYHQIIPTLIEFKNKFWGHGEVVLHEHDIRKPKDEFTILMKKEIREAFMTDINQFMQDVSYTLITSVIDKNRLKQQYYSPGNPYDISMSFCLERLYRFLMDKAQSEKITPVIVEKRGRKEDDKLELVFRRICDGSNYFNKPLPFQLVMIDKKANSAGLQIADLIARPIGIKIMRPQQKNRAYDILNGKFRKSPSGTVKGWGLKTFP